MESWNYRPARDFELTPVERARSLKREPGIWSSLTHLTWHSLAKSYLKTYHRLCVEGTEHLPAEPPFILIANHSSHLDAIVLGSALSRRLCSKVFPVAAGDIFFETPALSLLSAQVLNALPMWRKNCGPHALAELKERLVEEPCGYILFPEGARSRDGGLKPFKAGLGMIVAGTPVPVVPCWITGTMEAWHPESHWPKPGKVGLKIGPPLLFDGVPNVRAGWEQVAREAEAAVRRLGGGGIL
jgi:1-acyl-sn-glycerol-3-phosphate acyltransferase